MAGKKINHMLYADDLCVISLSSAGLQHLLTQCDSYCITHDLTFNVKKSVCMYFKCAVNKKCVPPSIVLSSKTLEFVDETKYLGVILNSTMKTYVDVARQTRKFYAQANMLIRIFSHCTHNVKCMLFRSSCTNMYCCPL